MLDILSKDENRSGSRGNYYSYELDVPFESAADGIADIVMLDAEIEKMAGIASRNGVGVVAGSQRQVYRYRGTISLRSVKRPDTPPVQVKLATF